MKTTKEKIEVMQAFDDGVDCQRKHQQNVDNEWVDLIPNKLTAWNWDQYDFRIKPAEPEMIPLIVEIIKDIKWIKNNTAPDLDVAFNNLITRCNTLKSSFEKQYPAFLALQHSYDDLMNFLESEKYNADNVYKYENAIFVAATKMFGGNDIFRKINSKIVERG